MDKISFTFNGDGTESNPYKINSADNLRQLADAVNSGGVIENVNLTKVEISGRYDVGGLVGFNDECATVKNCTVSDTSLLN